MNSRYTPGRRDSGKWAQPAAGVTPTNGVSTVLRSRVITPDKWTVMLVSQVNYPRWAAPVVFKHERRLDDARRARNQRSIPETELRLHDCYLLLPTAAKYGLQSRSSASVTDFGPVTISCDFTFNGDHRSLRADDDD